MSRWDSPRAQELVDALEQPMGVEAARPEVRQLVGVARTIPAAATAWPRDEFASALRQRLVAKPITQPARRVVRVQPARTPAAATAPRRRLAAAAAVFAVAGGSFGLVTTSAQALPGETLCSVKRGVERVDLALKRGDTAVGRTNLAHARERLAEAQALTSNGPVDARESDLVSATLSDFADDADAGAREMFRAYSDSGDAAVISEVSQFSAASDDALAQLSRSLPQTTEDAYTNAAQTVGAMRDASARMCTTCTIGGVDAPLDLSAEVQRLITLPRADGPKGDRRPARRHGDADGSTRHESSGDGSTRHGASGDGSTRHGSTGDGKGDSAGSGTGSGDQRSTLPSLELPPVPTAPDQAADPPASTTRGSGDSPHSEGPTTTTAKDDTKPEAGPLDGLTNGLGEDPPSDDPDEGLLGGILGG